MSDCHEIFQHYNATIKLSDDKREVLKGTRDMLRTRISTSYSMNAGGNYGHELEFQSQGSYVMDTIITPTDDDYDLDDGVYFLGTLPRASRPSTLDFHKLLIKLIGPIDKSIASVIDKETCVRVQTDKGFHIDLPIYYAGDKNCPDLAHTASDWTLSNPIEFIAWFEGIAQSGFQKGYLLEKRLFSEYKNWRSEIRKNDVQLRRLVRYLKAWGDLRRGEMPSGIIMTILAAENFSLDQRDDIALANTLKNMVKKLESEFVCRRPTTPKGEDLFAGYSQTRKDYFMTALKTFSNSAQQAIDSPNQREGCLKWQRHLGDRFPCQYAKDEITGSNTYRSPTVLGSSAASA